MFENTDFTNNGFSGGNPQGGVPEQGNPSVGSGQAPVSDSTFTSGGTFNRFDDSPQTDRGYGRAPEPAAERSWKEEAWKEERHTKKSGFIGKAVKAVALAVIFGAVAGGTFFGICKITGVLEPKTVEVPTVTIQDKVPEITGGISAGTVQNVETKVVASDVSAMVAETIPSIVAISKISQETESGFWGRPITYEAQSSGSGVIISQNDDELLIITNHHVAQKATKLEVTFVDNSKAEAKIKGMDSEMDLAVIAVPLSDIPAETLSQLRVAMVGDSDQLKLGEPAIVIGNALGIGISVTDGIISALEREMTTEDGNTGTFIQTNAAVNHGNSGGALLNIHGELVGIVSNKIDGVGVESMGYAIPISAANPIIQDLMERRTRGELVDESEAGYLGVSLQEISAEAKMYYNMPDGIYVYEVVEGSAADKAGIKRGDVITRLEGEKIGSFEDLKGILAYYKVGETVEVTIARQNEGEYISQNKTVVLGAKPED